MHYISYYSSPLGQMMLESDEEHLTGLWFNDQKHSVNTSKDNLTRDDVPVFKQTRRWLDLYFNGEQPDFLPPLRMTGSSFRKTVWKILLEIPYGKTTTYGDIARKIACRQGLASMSAQAVGGAVGHNTISIIVPCHRVIGGNGSLTGYASGMDRKIKLLEIEKVDMTHLFIPKKRTAL